MENGELRIISIIQQLPIYPAVSFFHCHSEAAIAAVGIRFPVLGITDCHGRERPRNDIGKLFAKSEFGYLNKKGLPRVRESKISGD